MVIVIVQELELEEAGASIVGAFSFLAGSADPGDEAMPKINRIARTEAKHRNLTSRLNVPSSHPSQDASSHKLLSLSSVVRQFVSNSSNALSNSAFRDSSL
jgi:hypothetical protein